MVNRAAFEVGPHLQRAWNEPDLTPLEVVPRGRQLDQVGKMTIYRVLNHASPSSRSKSPPKQLSGSSERNPPSCDTRSKFFLRHGALWQGYARQLIGIAIFVREIRMRQETKAKAGLPELRRRQGVEGSSIPIGIRKGLTPSK